MKIKTLFAIVGVTLNTAAFVHAQRPVATPYVQGAGPITQEMLNPWRAPDLLKEIDIQYDALEETVAAWAEETDSKSYAQAVVNVTVKLVTALTKLEDLHTASQAKNECAMMTARLMAFTERVLQISQLEFRVDTLPKDVAEAFVEGISKGDFETVMRGAGSYLVVKIAASQQDAIQTELREKAAESIRRFGNDWGDLTGPLWYSHGEYLAAMVNGQKTEYLIRNTPNFVSPGNPKQKSQKNVWKAKVVLMPGETGSTVMKAVDDGAFLEVPAGLEVTVEERIEGGNPTAICILPDGRKVKYQWRNIQRDEKSKKMEED